MRNRITEDNERPIAPLKKASELAKERLFKEEEERKAAIKSFEKKVEDCFIEPGPGKIVVAPPDEVIKRGLLYIPRPDKEALATMGTILKVGVGCDLIFKDKVLSPGDRVVYGTWTGTGIKFDERPVYRILHETEVLGVIVGEPTKLLDVVA